VATPHDPDARITKMKDGRTHLAHKAEHAVDLETGAIVGVTVQGADHGRPTTLAEIVTMAAEELEAVAVATDDHTAVIDEVVADTGNVTVADIERPQFLWDCYSESATFEPFEDAAPTMVQMANSIQLSANYDLSKAKRCTTGSMVQLRLVYFFKGNRVDPPTESRFKYGRPGDATP
jgi:hypothetical protein